MSQNIYNIGNWAQNQSYLKNDIVIYQNVYYYALINHNSGLSFDSTNWTGTITDNGQLMPYFVWKPSYNTSTTQQPRAKVSKFGDGYEQTMQDGINNDLLTLDLPFDLRTQQEATAIIHFLTSRSAVQSFIFMPPPPYGINKRFKCREWQPTYIFKDNYSIKAKFEEVVI